VFHLSPAKIADAAFVYALTNGLHMVQVRAIEPMATVDDTPAGKVEVGSFTVAAEITVDFTLSANAPWKTVDETTVSLLYSNDPTKLIVGKATRLAPKSVAKNADGSYRATFDKPTDATGFFVVCVGDCPPPAPEEFTSQRNTK